MSRGPHWSWQPAKLSALLRGLGYDVDLSDAAERSGSLRGRRDRGARSHVVVLDAGGRFRAQVTHVREEARRVASIAGFEATIIRATEQTEHITATLTDPQQLEPLLRALDETGTFPRDSRKSEEQADDPDWSPAPLPGPPDPSGK